MTVYEVDNTSQNGRPIRFARIFCDGEIASGKYPQPQIAGQSITTWQADVKNRWADGSVKIADIAFVQPTMAVPTGTNPTLQVNTTAVTASSRIFLEIDESLTISATTCNTTLTTLVQPVVTARTPGTSFTIQVPATLVTNPACVSYHIIN